MGGGERGEGEGAETDLGTGGKVGSEEGEGVDLVNLFFPTVMVVA